MRGCWRQVWEEPAETLPIKAARGGVFVCWADRNPAFGGVEGVRGAKRLWSYTQRSGSGRRGVGGQGGCVLGSRSTESREGEESRERVHAYSWEKGVGLLQACVCRACAKMGVTGETAQGPLPAPGSPVNRGQSLPSCSQKKSGLHCLSSGLPQGGWSGVGKEAAA